LNTKGDETSFDIWVTQLAGGDAVNLTADHAGSDRWPAWSPDGSRIAFWSEREGGGYFVMSALGGSVRRLIERPLAADPWWGWWTGPEWSPDGRELAAVVYEESGAYAHVVSLASGESRRWLLPGGENYRQDLAWSRDARFLAYVVGAAISDVTELRVVRFEGQKAVSVTDGRTRVMSPFWSSNGRFLHFVSNRGGSLDLWRQRMRHGIVEGAPERITTGIGITSAAFSPDGRRLAYSLARLTSNVWRVPILTNRAATWADAERITFDEAYIETMDVSPDGTRLVVGSDRSGNHDLWILPSEGGEMQQLTTDPTPDWYPAWSPSGEEVAFYSYRSGLREIWVQPVAGGPARRLTQGSSPIWSPDGEHVLFVPAQEGSADIWVVPVAGGKPRPFITHPSYDRAAQWSPDGSWLAFVSGRSGTEAIWRLAAEGGEPELVVEDGYGPCWSSDGEWIYYVGGVGKSGNLWAVSVDGNIERPMTDLSGRRGGPGMSQRALSCGGAYLYFTWQEDRGDIWVADVVHE
jgi:Tol biopolymer transport system component